MARKRNTITSDMLEAAKAKGWSAAQTARHYGMDHTTIGAACRRLGIKLPRNHHSPPTPYVRKEKLIAEASDERVLAWSCSPAAIRKALSRRGRP